MGIISELNLYPIKSCAAIALEQATLTSAGLMSRQIYDREWMVVGPQGQFLSQREHPRMATIQPYLKADYLEVRAPGMLPLALPLDLSDPEQAPTLEVQVWDDRMKAYDCDATTATWFSNAVGAPCRLARFHPHASRTADMSWTQGVAAPTLFSDGFPLLVIAQASLDDLNVRLLAAGRSILPMNRFRPNIVISGIHAFDEDHAESLATGSALLKPVKPCSRCLIPSIDQASGSRGPDPIDILQVYRSNARLGGAVTFGMNTIVLEGAGTLLRLGQQVEINLAF